MSRNSYQNLKIRGLKRKIEYILSRGGKCERCGYDKNIAALDFHHINPKEKEFLIDSRKFANCSLQDLKSELDKCMILCANCHREIHHPDLEFLEVLESEYLKSNKKSFSTKDNKKESICPVCGTHFKPVNGKIYCCKECREKAKNYPTKKLVEDQYSILKSWEKVAKYFGLTRKIILRIRRE